MDALDTASRRNSLARGTAPASSSCCRVAAMVGKLAIVMAGSLLVASMSMFMFASAALAHAPIQPEGRHPSHQVVARSPQSEAINPAAPPGCVRSAVIVVPVAGLVADSRLSDQHSTPGQNGSDDIGFDADCCGVACHAALGNVGRISGARRPPVSAVVPAGTSSLHGRSQGPPERPPRQIA